MMRELVFVVVDAEAAREAGTDARQRIAIAPQQPHAEGMKGGEVRRGIESYTSLSSAATRSRISSGGLVGEGDRQNGGRRHVPRRDDVRDAVRDDPGFAAARAGQNQQRPFGAGDRFALLRVQALEEIHVRGGLYEFYHAPRTGEDKPGVMCDVEPLRPATQFAAGT